EIREQVPVTSGPHPDHGQTDLLLSGMLGQGAAAHLAGIIISECWPPDQAPCTVVVELIGPGLTVGQDHDLGESLLTIAETARGTMRGVTVRARRPGARAMHRPVSLLLGGEPHRPPFLLSINRDSRPSGTYHFRPLGGTLPQRFDFLPEVAPALALR